MMHKLISVITVFRGMPFGRDLLTGQEAQPEMMHKLISVITVFRGMPFGRDLLDCFWGPRAPYLRTMFVVLLSTLHVGLIRCLDCFWGPRAPYLRTMFVVLLSTLHVGLIRCLDCLLIDIDVEIDCSSGTTSARWHATSATRLGWEAHRYRCGDRLLLGNYIRALARDLGDALGVGGSSSTVALGQPSTPIRAGGKRWSATARRRSLAFIDGSTRPAVDPDSRGRKALVCNGPPAESGIYRRLALMRRSHRYLPGTGAAPALAAEAQCLVRRDGPDEAVASVLAGHRRRPRPGRRGTVPCSARWPCKDVDVGHRPRGCQWWSCLHHRQHFDFGERRLRTSTSDIALGDVNGGRVSTTGSTSTSANDV